MARYRTLYMQLDQPPCATDEELHAAFVRLAVQLHPDKAGATSAKLERFKAVSAAYGVLRWPHRRAAYDKELALLGRACPACAGRGRARMQHGFTFTREIPCAACDSTGQQEQTET